MGGTLSLIGEVDLSSLIGGVRGPVPKRRPGERKGLLFGKGAETDSGDAVSSGTATIGQRAAHSQMSSTPTFHGSPVLRGAPKVFKRLR